VVVDISETRLIQRIFDERLLDLPIAFASFSKTILVPQVFAGIDYSELPIAQPQQCRGMNIFCPLYFQAEGLRLGSPRSGVST
jgi:hypothetical protein